MTDTVQGFSAMLRGALGDRIAVDAESFLDMVADDVIMEFPFAPAGLPTRLDGREAIADHLAKLAERIDIAGVGDPAVHEGAEAGFTVLEFNGTGRGVASGAPYEQRYVSLIWTSRGRIVRYRDYWNPLAVLRALTGPAIEPALAADWSGHD